TAMYDSIEVVRGATGLMSGMGTPAASINLVRKRPTAEGQASITAEAGSWDRYGLGADLSGPLSDNGKLRGRLVVDEENQHSWIDRYEKRNRLVYGITELDLSRSTLLTVGLSYEKNENDSPLRTGLPFTYSNGAPTNFKRSTNAAPDWSYYDSELTNLFASVKHDFGKGWNGKVEVTHTQYNYDSALYFLTGSIDQRTGGGASVWPVRWKSNDKQTTLDAQLSGPFDLLGRQHEVVAGISLSQLRSDTPDYGSWLGPWTGYDGSIADFRHWDGASNTPDFVKAGQTNTKETQYSAYLTTRFKLADPTSLIAGARVINWERKADTSVVGVPGSTHADTRETGVIVPYAGLVHDLNENWTVYGSYTRIFSPQSASTRDVNNTVLDPERGTSYELGIKSSFLEDRLNAGLALFKTRQSNLANYDAATSSYVALQGIQTKGAELEALASLGNVDLVATYTFLDAKVAKGTPAEQGRQLASIPRHMASFWANYRFSVMGTPGFLAGAGVRYNGSSDDGTGHNGVPAVTLYDAVLAYDAGPMRFALNVTNLFDKQYVGTCLARGDCFFGTRRTVVGSVTYRF
ncbi:MAG: TonB-dependent siderophore receptor, partial [Achromobacter sp.]|nr:TonB-dependent siderophore receptor [Achromobacter sp.]